MTDTHVLSGVGAPSSVPPMIGAHYIDTLNSHVYEAKGTITASDWIRLVTIKDAAAIIKAHKDEANPHSQYATDTDLANHVSAADPHSVYQKEEAGKGLSTNDYSTADKNKVASLVANSVVTVTASTTMGSTHNGAHVVANSASEVVITVPSSGVSAGAEIAVEKVGAGKVKFAAASGATLRFPASIDPWVAEKYGVARLKAVTASIWSLTGDLADHTPSRWMLVGGGYSGVTIYDTTSMDRMDPGLTMPNSSGKPAFSPDRKLLAVGLSVSPYLNLYNTEGWSQKWDGPVDLPPAVVNDLQFSPDGQYLAAAHNAEPYLSVWNTSDWSRVTLPAGAITANAMQVAWSPDSSKLVVCGTQPYMKTFDAATWTLTTGPVNTDYAVYQMDFSPDGQYLGTMQVYGDEFVIYNTSDWTKRAALAGRPSFQNPTHFFWSPDSSKFVAAGNLAPYMVVYETTTWASISSFPVAITRGPDKVCLDGETLFSFYNSTPRMVRHKLSDWTVLPDMTVPFTSTVGDVELSAAI